MIYFGLREAVVLALVIILLSVEVALTNLR